MANKEGRMKSARSKKPSAKVKESGELATALDGGQTCQNSKSIVGGDSCSLIS